MTTVLFVHGTGVRNPGYEETFQLIKHLNNLAYLYKSQGRYAEAEPFYLQALAIAERQLGVNHPNTVTIRENLQSLQERDRR